MLPPKSSKEALKNASTIAQVGDLDGCVSPDVVGHYVQSESHEGPEAYPPDHREQAVFMRPVAGRD
jgi:hypothetical protein